MRIFDNFLASYDDLKSHIKSAVFSDSVNPVDGATYPHICLSIPDNVRAELIEKITGIIGRAPNNITMFMRKSPAGVHVPHMAHTDNSMGLFSLMLYCNDFEGGGTALLRHRETGICYAPGSQEYVELMQRDQNNPSAWAILEMAKMKENRCAIFDAGRFHCAMPVGGFGDLESGRVVLTVFFS